MTRILLSALRAGQENGAPPPTTAQEYLRRGEERAGAHDYDGAIADYNMALQLKSDYAEAYNDRGHAYYWKGDHPKAIADFTRAIQLRPAYPNAFNNRGAAYMASGHSRRAVADFDQALKLKPDFRNAYVNRANALGFRHWRQSLNDFHRAGMHPERTAALAGGGMLLLAGAGAFALVRLRRRLAGDGHRR
ncbi:MAG: tetratricopeptide repeat protein [Acidobacteriia bacterium]|nr:tetratricopeptide repeat protein [Terriglobia bacterium]